MDVPVGPLALNDADSAAATAAAGSFLGLDLSGDLSYMLVTMNCVSGKATHEFFSDPSAKDRGEYLTAAAKTAIGRLTPAQEPTRGSVLYDSKITLAEAAEYVSAIYDLGTHFVSEITAGDILLQVFAYDAKQFKQIIQPAFADESTIQPDGSRAVTGAAAAAWEYYTSKYDGTYGFVSSYGTLVCLSRDPALATAISNSDWDGKFVPKGTPSVFAAAHQYKLMTPLTKDVPIGLTMTPIAELIPNLLIAGPWDRLVKGGLLQKYGDGVTVPLTRQVNQPWSKIFPETIESWTSNIVTPRIDIYQERVDLAKVKLEGGTIVANNFAMQSFTSFSQVLEASTQPGDGPIALPSDDITLAAQIIDMTQALQTPVLTMSAAGLEKINVVCEDMYGTLIFQDNTPGSSTRKVALDGFLFETPSEVDPTTQRYKVNLSRFLTDKPGAALVSEWKQSIEFSIVAAESLLQLGGRSPETVRQLEQAYLLWLAGIIPADTQDADLANNRARALYLAHNVSTFGSDTVEVPYVTYGTYNKYVNDLVTEAQTLNSSISAYQIQITNTINSYKVMDSIANLNDNIKQIGGVLTSYFQALATGREAMDSYYDSIIDELDKELQKTLGDIKGLSAKLQAQQAVISQTGDPPGIVQKFEQDYASYSQDQVFQCVISGVEALFSLGLAMAAIPEAAEVGVLKALNAIKDVYEKLKAVMKVLEALKAIEDIAGKVEKINELSNTISALGNTKNLQMPSQVDLKLMKENVRAALVNVPDKGNLNQDKANLIAAVDSLVIIGSAMLQPQIKASQILVQISNNNRLKTINGQQQGRLEALTNSLHLQDPGAHPDVNSIDLIGVTGQLQFQLKQVLTVLARTIELQDSAIQYEYFGEPTAITSFSLLNLEAVITRQDSNIINALQQLDPQPQSVPDPIKFTVKNVLVAKISGTNVFEFAIPLSHSAFYSYDMVRIDRVLPNVKGIKSTGSGNYEIHLTCQAKPFQDRDYHRQPRTYASVQREFGPYVYNVSTGAAEFGTGTGTFADQVTHLTPFSLWQVSLPGNVKNNQDIEFDSLFVDVELEFYITAHYDDPATRHIALLARAGADTTTSADSPSLANLEAQMYQNQAVLQHWDAAFIVLEGPVNAFLYQQFQQYIKTLNPNSAESLMEVSAYYCDNVEEIQRFWFTNVTKMTFKLSNPLLQFVPGNDSVTVKQNILSGTVLTGTLTVTETDFDPSKCQLVDGDVNFTADSSTNTLALSVGGVFENNMQVKLKTTGTLPAPLKADTDYWVVGWTTTTADKITTTKLQLSETAKGPAIDLTNDGAGTHAIYPDIEWGPPNTVEISKNPYVQGSVALARISGIVNPPSGQGDADETHTVVLDFPSGSFTLNHFAVDPPNWDPSHHATRISNALANFYATHDIKYQVLTVNYANLSKDAALQPSQFMLHAKTTNAGNNILEMMIATTGQVQHATSILLNEPIAYDPDNPVPSESDFMVSLMLNTKLMFGHIFVDSFNRGGTNISVQAVNPGKDFEAWSAVVVSGVATGTVQFKDAYDVDGTKTQFRISASGNQLPWDLKGMTFERTATAGITLNFLNGTASPPKGGTPVDFQYRTWQPAGSTPQNYIPARWGQWWDAGANAYITMTGNYPLEVTGTGREQEVRFSTLEPHVTFSKSSDLKPATGCHCNDNAIKIALLDELGTTVPGTLKAYIGEVTFKYGPINPAIGGMVDYTIDIENGTVSPPLIVVVDQPDPDTTPATVILLPPGYLPSDGVS